MADELPESPEAQPEAAEVAQPRRRRRWKWPLILVAVVVAVPVLIFAAWSWFALSYTYSHGNRAGYIQKFSKKGWICKTWEGELAMVNIPGAAQERWTFTVRNDSVAAAISSLMGDQVSLTYEEHPGVPTSCFGDTRYFVTGVRPVVHP